MRVFGVDRGLSAHFIDRSDAETQSLYGRRPESQTRSAVISSRVSFVTFKAIAGLDPSVARHPSVPGHFRHNRRGHDFGHQGVAAHDRASGNVELRSELSVDDHFFDERFAAARSNERGEGSFHGEECGVVYVEPVDLFGPRPADSHIRVCETEPATYSLARFGSKRLRISQLFRRVSGGKDDGRGGNGAGERTATGFVYAAEASHRSIVRRSAGS